MQTTEEQVNKQGKKPSCRNLLTVLMAVAIAALAAVAVEQGVQLRSSKAESAERTAQIQEQAKQAEEQAKQIEDQAQRIQEQLEKIQELEQQNQQQAEKLKELENQRISAPVATPNAPDPNGPAYQSLYPDFYAPQALDATVSKAKTAYLTFDDGPSDNTDTILQTLQEEGVKATFFVIGHSDEKELGRMRRIVQEGHTIGMHSYSHSYKKIYASVEAFLEDMYQVFKLIRDTTGVTPTCFRFPGGSINGYNKAVYKDIKAEMMRRGFVPYDWNVSSGDAGSDGYPPEQLIQNVLGGISGKTRAIVLMHDSAAKKTTAQAVRQMIEGIRDKGFSLEPLDHHVKPILF